MKGLIMATLLSLNSAMDVSIEQGRRAFYRGEVISLTVTVRNTSDTKVENVAVEAKMDAIKANASINQIDPGASTACLLRLPTAQLKCGEYPVRIADTSETFWICERPAKDRLTVWLWPHQAYEDSIKPFDDRADEIISFWRKCGFNNVGSNREMDSADTRWMDLAMRHGATIGLKPFGGLYASEFENLTGDMIYPGHASSHLEPGKLANPFHPEIARQHDANNRRLMQVARRYPQVTTTFMNTELVDALRINTNEAGKRLIQEHLGSTNTSPKPAVFVKPDVIADDDDALRLARYRFKYGDGLGVANQRTADMIHRYRPDILTIHDPYRQHGVLDTFAGVDVVSTWTYTNPDPKMMLYVEMMRAACVERNQFHMSEVTLLNYPGELDPTEEWMMMGPGRLAVTTWINLSRAPQMVGFYFSSQFDPFGALENDLSTPAERSDYEMPQATFDLLERLSREVFEPYGPMIRKLKVPKRRIAVLNSYTSRLHTKNKPLPGYYANYQAMHLFTVLSMAHFEADFVLDETVERFGLDDYDVVILPKCEVLTETVHRAIERFDGLVVGDQYLGPKVADVTFDFDFTYRDRVRASAIEKGETVDRWDDQVDPKTAKTIKAQGVTARDDQNLMESFARQLDKTLTGKAPRRVHCDSYTALTNLCEGEGAEYLFVINDERDYDDRVGKYKAVLGKVLPQTAKIKVDDAEPVAYDLLRRERLTVDDGEFEVKLDELGGTIVAFYPKAIGSIHVNVPKKVKAGNELTLAITMTDEDGAPLPGLQPVEVIVTDGQNNATEHSGYHVARRGLLQLPIATALNDARGPWTITVRDLTAGLKATEQVVVD